MVEKTKSISIMILSHNAPRYVLITLGTIKRKTREVVYDVVVVDNRSRITTRLLLRLLKRLGMIDRCYFNQENSLFAKGNNIAFSMVKENVDAVLLLNSDVAIKDSEWLRRLVDLHDLHDGGATSFGAVREPPIRADGYCLLVDRDLYERFGLDESFEWFWSVTKLQCQIALSGKTVWAIDQHEEFIHHYGGKSGKGFKDAEGMDTKLDTIRSWFNERVVSNIRLFDNYDEARRAIQR